MVLLTKLRNCTYTSKRLLFSEVVSNRGGMLECSRILEYTIGCWNYTVGEQSYVYIVPMLADLQ